MDEECIDSFKLNRFELLFYYFNGFNLFKKGVFTIADLGTIAVALVVAAVVLGMGATILEKVGEATITVSNTSSSTQGLVSLESIAEFIPTIAIVAVAAVVLGTVVTMFGRPSGLGREKKEYTSMNKLLEKEKEFNKNYYKVEPEFDEAKQSWLAKTFKFSRYKK